LEFLTPTNEKIIVFSELKVIGRRRRRPWPILRWYINSLFGYR
jgi:hypothetical protein